MGPRDWTQQKFNNWETHMLSFGVAGLLFMVPPALPQHGAEHLPSRNVPAKTCCLRIEVPEPLRLIEHGDKLLQVRLIRWAAQRGLLERASRQEIGLATLWRRSAAVRQFFGGFDDGLTFALLRAPSETNLEVSTALIGSASQGRRLRGHDKLLLDLIRRDTGDFQVEHFPVLDSPVPIRWIHIKKWPPEEDRRWVRDSAIFDAIRGRRAAYVLFDRRVRSAARQRAPKLTGTLLGMLGGGKKRFLPATPEGATPLAAIRYRPKILRGGTKVWFHDLLAADCLQSIDAVLYLLDGVVEERVDILVEHERTLFDTVRFAVDAKRQALRSAARLLPADTAVFWHARLDAKHATTWYNEGPGSYGFLQADFLHIVREQLGLKPEPQNAPGDLQGLHELAFAVVPGIDKKRPLAPLLLVKGDFVAQPAQSALEATVGHLRNRAGAGAKRSVERTGDVVTLVLPNWRVVLPGLWAVTRPKRLAATKVGDWLVFADDPRVLAAVIDRAAGNDSLATRNGFLAGFPADRSIGFQGFFDGRALALHADSYRDLLPMVGLLLEERGDLPRIADLAPLLTTETFWLEKDGAGHHFRHRGGTLLSPTAWGAAAPIGYLIQLARDLIRR